MADLDTTHEVWRLIPGASFEASSLGQVRPLLPKRLPGTALSQSINPQGKCYVTLCERGQRKTKAVHRLVAAAFHGKPTKGRPEVNHIDGDRANNRPENLEYCSRSENMIHAYRVLGRYPTKARPRGATHWKAALTEGLVRVARARHAAGERIAQIAVDLGVSRQAVGECVRRVTWRHVS